MCSGTAAGPEFDIADASGCVWQHGAVQDNATTEDSGVRLVVLPGNGRLARRGATALYVPAVVVAEAPHDVDELFDRFSTGTSPANAVADSSLPHCLLDWSHLDGHVAVLSTIELFTARRLGGWERNGTERLHGPRARVDPVPDGPIDVTTRMSGWTT